MRKDIKRRRVKAFTMAEILLSLTIIGVVAAITLPSLTGNINERTWNTQRKALYARMSQAIALMPALNGYGTLVEGNDSTSAIDTATATFLSDGLAKVLKINNICDNAHLMDCGIVPEFTNMAASKTTTPTTLYELNSWFQSATYSSSSYSTIDTKAAAFETQNGESIVAYYNQSCRTEYLNSESLNSDNDLYGFSQSNMCVNFIYDLNGNKGPNTVGKDIGIMTVFNATDSIVVAPMPTSTSNVNNNTSINWTEASKACSNSNPAARLPNIDELSAMLINKNIVNLDAAANIWSSTSAPMAGRVWGIQTTTGIRGTCVKNQTHYARCVKR